MKTEKTTQTPETTSAIPATTTRKVKEKMFPWASDFPVIHLDLPPKDVAFRLKTNFTAIGNWDDIDPDAFIDFYKGVFSKHVYGNSSGFQSIPNIKLFKGPNGTIILEVESKHNVQKMRDGGASRVKDIYDSIVRSFLANTTALKSGSALFIPNASIPSIQDAMASNQDLTVCSIIASSLDVSCADYGPGYKCVAPNNIYDVECIHQCDLDYKTCSYRGSCYFENVTKCRCEEMTNYIVYGDNCEEKMPTTEYVVALVAGIGGALLMLCCCCCCYVFFLCRRRRRYITRHRYHHRYFLDVVEREPKSSSQLTTESVPSDTSSGLYTLTTMAPDPFSTQYYRTPLQSNYEAFSVPNQFQETTSMPRHIFLPGTEVVNNTPSSRETSDESLDTSRGSSRDSRPNNRRKNKGSPYKFAIPRPKI